MKRKMFRNVKKLSWDKDLEDGPYTKDAYTMRPTANQPSFINFV